MFNIMRSGIEAENQLRHSTYFQNNIMAYLAPKMAISIVAIFPRIFSGFLMIYSCFSSEFVFLKMLERAGVDKS